MSEPYRMIRQLREPGDLTWYLVPLFVLVIYLYVNEAERKNWSALFLGIAFWAWAMTWEIGNSLFWRFTGFAPLWTVENGNGSVLVYVGMNIEVCFFVALMGPLIIKLLPADQSMKIFKLPNRLFIAGSVALVAVMVETFLHAGGLITWSWKFWGNPWRFPIWFGYASTWYILTLAHDRLGIEAKKRLMIAMLVFFAILHGLFALWLDWV